MKTLKIYQYSHEAHIDLSLLESEEIQAFLKDENMASINPIYSNAIGGIKLQVREEDYEKALEIINSQKIELDENFEEED